MTEVSISLFSSDYILQAVDVTRTFGSGSTAVHALKGVSLSIRQGSLVALKGRSGSGKTTLLNLFGALDLPTSGSVLYFGTELAGMNEKNRTKIRREQIGLVFQSFALIPYMSAYENVEFGLRVAGVPASDRKLFAVAALEAVGLQKRMYHRPSELSGGEQQRVAIARGIAHRPRLLLADEPTAELDSRMSIQIMNAFRELVQQYGISIVMTTHDPAMMELVDHVFALEDGRVG